ncbi:CPBP family intramembrane glutamic endopeptidase [Levilactobacillus suantsaiihabitans]|uniref:CPBP family intramembrane metalloprotease n=1 Tax=Levilactobacillus suantsaiihabitans TaxID=2487722 RepID=A0A4Z0J7X8_9LACO|nr:type II CAAX endopeptidase family protein [Levilactobacillus suantsaiihabitans]TGD17478.1 CPBP family intramembrane metalloprotease [Levilactobacillus suantsaiihabitans]
MTNQNRKLGSTAAWLWLILLVIILNLVQLPLLFLNHGAIGQRFVWSAIYVAGFAAVIALGLWIYRRVHPVKWQRLTRQDWWLMVKAYGFVILVEMVLGMVNSLLYHQTSTANNQAISSFMNQGTLTMVMLSLTAVLASPVIEELTFRGVLIDGCFPANMFWLPIIVSGVAFSIVHMSTNPVSWLIYAMMGGTFAYVYKRTGKLQSTIFLHGFNNLIAVGLMLLTLH